MFGSLYKLNIEKNKPVVSVELSKQFINGLKEYDIDIEDVKNNFKYCGGNSGSHLKYFRLSCPTDDLPEIVSECVCGHVILHNCYITDGERILILGNCCIKRFCETSNRSCEVCCETHRNTKQNRCNKCKIIEKKPTSPTTKKLCDKCGTSHLNRVINRCNKCRSHMCDKCDKYKSSSDYKTCYDCFSGNTRSADEIRELIKRNTPSVDEIRYCKNNIYGICKNKLFNKYDTCYSCYTKRREEYEEYKQSYQIQKPQRINDEICFLKTIKL
jgi:hypothetical protein